MTAGELSLDDVRIVDVRQLNRWKARRALRRLHREVLVPSFAPSELCSRHELRRDVLGPDARARAYVALDPSGAVIAGLVADYDAASRVGLVAYVAVRPECRGQGVGSMMDVAFAAAFIGEVDPALVLGEVQDPRVHPRTERQDPMARLRLYDRLGVRLLPMPYVMPKLRPEDERVPGTLLVAYYVEPATGVDAVPSELLDRYLRRYVIQCEGEEALVAEPEIAAMFAHLGGRSEVPLLPLLREGRLMLADGHLMSTTTEEKDG